MGQCRESPWLIPVHCTFQHGASHSSMSACRWRPLPALHLIASFIPWTKVSPPLITCPSVGYFARYSEKTGAYGEEDTLYIKYIMNNTTTNKIHNKYPDNDLIIIN